MPRIQLLVYDWPLGGPSVQTDLQMARWSHIFTGSGAPAGGQLEKRARMRISTSDQPGINKYSTVQKPTRSQSQMCTQKPHQTECLSLTIEVLMSECQTSSYSLILMCLKYNRNLLSKETFENETRVGFFSPLYSAN